MRKFLVFLTGVIYAGFFSASMAQAQHVTKIKAADLACNGESFFDLSNISSELTRLAKADGYIGSNESFRDVSVSGASISAILNQYKNCNPKPIYLVSDGAGIDLMNGNCSDENCSVIKNCKATLQSYLAEMKKGGTKKLLWMIYPDPQKTYAGTLKTNQDIWAQVVPPVINACKDPKTLLVDLRPIWAGHYDQYTSDGIHCTDAGGTATAKAFWKAMKDSNFFDTGSAITSVSKQTLKTAQPMFLGHSVSNNSVLLSLYLAQPTTGLAMRITTVLGRTVIAASKNEQFAGHQTIKFPLSSIAPGVYCLEIKAGTFSECSSLFLR